MKQETRKRIGIISSSLMISLSMMLSILPQRIKATEEDVLPATPYVNQSEEHIHDENCGYVEAKEEVACNHIHDETCGELADEVDDTECQHIHGDCSYQEVIEGQPCKLQKTNLNAEINMGINQLTDVVVEEVEITFDDDIENTMTTAIAKAMEGKTENEIKAITTIKVTGNAAAITDKNWRALLNLYAKDSGYSSLKALDLSAMSRLTTIASYTIASINPTQLTTVNLPDTLTEIGKYTFMNCENLNISQLPSKLETIGDGAFNSCSSLSLTELPDTITSIGENAFKRCAKLALTKLPQKLTIINNFTFLSCTSLSITALPQGITSVGQQAFEGSGITEIVIPYSVSWIGSRAFNNCKNLKKITFERSTALTLDSEVFANIAQAGIITYPYNGTGYDGLIQQSFSNWTQNYNTLILIYNDGKICEEIDKIKLSEEAKEKITTIRVIGDATSIKGVNDWLSLLELFDTNSGYSSELTLDLSEMSNLQAIGDYIQSMVDIISPSKLKEVKLPNSLETIGNYTFMGCTKLTAINLPDGLKKIGNNAFNSCSSLELYKLPDSIEYIGYQAFNGCKKISLTKLPDSLKTLGHTAFTNCEQLAITELPKNIQVINLQTFSGTGIKEIVIHGGITEIQWAAFYNCKSLSKITFMGDIPTIGDRVFAKGSETAEVHYTEGASGYDQLSKVLPEGWKIFMIEKPTPSGSSSSHSHYYGKQWKTDEENHWHECSCGKQKDLEAHEFDEWVVIDEEHRERECLICGYIQKETFAHRQLTDAVTGVQLSGTMSERAELVVSESPTHAVGLCSACDEIRSLMSEGKLIKAYEISLKGEYKGELTLSFPMDPKYNGESFMLYHYVEDGRADQQISVNNGKAEGKVQTLSPFAIVRSNETITQQVSLNQGEQITIYPATMDGVWAYDDEMIQLTQNKDSYTITAIKEGSTSAVYTTKTTQTIVDVNIPASHVPNTNDAMNRYILISILSLCGVIISNRFRKQNQ